MKKLLFILFSFISIAAYSQQIILTAVSADCVGAIEIKDSVIAKNSPDGYGKIFEYPTSSFSYGPQDSVNEGEHNSVWYKLAIPYSSKLALDIIPTSINDDYDFIIYKYTGNEKDFCEKIKNKQLKPERMIISQNDTTIGGRTGLAYNKSKHDIAPGPGDSYGEALSVIKGEVYYLQLDNVHKGKGHKLILHFIKEEKTEKNFKFQNIYFKADKYEILETSVSTIDSLYNAMNNNPEIKIELYGNVNWQSSWNIKVDNAALQKLSNERAKAVSTYLVNKGISADRIICKGFANTKMIYPNTTIEVEQEMNRRVEVKVISK